MNRITKTVAIAALAAIGVIGTAAGANAAVSYDPATGIGHVDKSDVQAATAFKWNNADFDAKQAGLTFRVSGDFTQTQHFTGVVNGVTYHGTLVTTGTSVAAKPTPIKSANGKQVTGWDLTPIPGTIKGGTTQYPGSLMREYNAYQMAVLLGGTVDEAGKFSLTVEGTGSGIEVTSSADGTRNLPLTPQEVAAP